MSLIYILRICTLYMPHFFKFLWGKCQMDQLKDFSGRMTFPAAPLTSASLLTCYLLMAIIEVAKDGFHHNQWQGRYIFFLSRADLVKWRIAESICKKHPDKDQIKWIMREPLKLANNLFMKGSALIKYENIMSIISTMFMADRSKFDISITPSPIPSLSKVNTTGPEISEKNS